MRDSIVAVHLLAAVLIGGCSGASGLTTGSLFGSGDAKQPVSAADVLAPTGDPTSRAFQVGSVSARAVKCGYNFDPATLKAKFLAAETANGTNQELLARAERIYDISYNGVWKGIAKQNGYCTPKRTKQVKAELTRHLAGDFTVKKKKVTKTASGGFFSGFWGSGGDTGPGLDIKPSTYEPF